MDLTCTTELEAVNSMLLTIGESPVNTLEVTGVSDVSIAMNTLREATRSFQTLGWEFNTEIITLTPDNEGNINLPASILKIDSTDINRKYVRRDSRIYDRTNSTFVFTEPVTLKVVYFIDFEDLPEPARQYITIRAARRFQNRAVGSDAIAAYTKEDEFEALITFKEYEVETGDFNMLRDSVSMSSVVRR